MTRLLLGLALVLSVGCNKPSGGDCRKAIANMQVLLGTEHLAHDSDIEGEVRRCKGSSKKKAVDCAIAAKSIDDLRACDFMRIPANTGKTPDAGSAIGSGTGSATGSASGSGSGSTLGSGSATGSGSAMGSAGTSAGSGLGSAIAAGTTAGSAAGSGSATGPGPATGSGSATK